MKIDDLTAMDRFYNAPTNHSTSICLDADAVAETTLQPCWREQVSGGSSVGRIRANHGSTPPTTPPSLHAFADVSTEVASTSPAVIAWNRQKESITKIKLSNDWSYSSGFCGLGQISLPRLQSFHRSVAGHITNHKTIRGYIAQTTPDCFPLKLLLLLLYYI